MELQTYMKLRILILYTSSLNLWRNSTLRLKVGAVKIGDKIKVRFHVLWILMALFNFYNCWIETIMNWWLLYWVNLFENSFLTNIDETVLISATNKHTSRRCFQSSSSVVTYAQASNTDSGSISFIWHHLHVIQCEWENLI